MPPRRRPREASASAAPRPLVPPARLFVTLASLAAAALLVRAGLLEKLVGGIVDAAVQNIITLILGFSGLMAVLGWFLFQSGHAPGIKRAVALSLLATVGLGCALFRIERVSGDLVPELVFRWRPSRDRLLPSVAPPAERSPGAAWADAPGDFPRFLGPQGSASLEGPILDPAWESRPPERLWRRPIGAGWSGFATCGDHAVTLEQRGDDEVVSCQSISTGEVEWTVSVPGRHETVLGGVGPRSTPTIATGVVFTTGATGRLHAIDGGSGRVLWRKSVLEDLGIDPAAHALAVAWGRSGSPLVTESLVIVPGGGPRQDGSAVSLVAYDRATGERRWTGGDEQISYASPQLATIGGREVVLTVNESSVAAHDPVGGERLWRFDWPGHSNSDATCSQACVLDGDRIFLSKGYGIGAAMFRRTAGEAVEFVKQWAQPAALKTKFTNVAIVDGHAYGLSDGILECVSLADGRSRWKRGRYGQGQVLRVGGLLLVQAESGEVVAVRCTPDAHDVMGRFAALQGQTWNNLCLAGDRLLVRNAEEAACYRLPLAARGPVP
ncbi:MAG: PQQ-binding-like beta-propeller repeat protein [Planctomycetota bacterium]